MEGKSALHSWIPQGYSLKSLRDIHFPTPPGPQPSKPRMEVWMPCLLQCGTYKAGPLCPSLELGTASSQKWKHSPGVQASMPEAELNHSYRTRLGADWSMDLLKLCCSGISFLSGLGKYWQQKYISYPFPFLCPVIPGSQLPREALWLGNVPDFTCIWLIPPVGSKLPVVWLWWCKKDTETHISKGLLAGKDTGPSLLAKWLCR